MAPTWIGPARQAVCEECGYRFLVDDATYSWEFPTRCRCCGGQCTVADRVIPGQTASIQAVASPREIQRLDAIVFKTEGETQSTVKRVWGLPGESIELRSGELWVGGHLFQKDMQQLKAICVNISHFPSDRVSHWEFKINSEPDGVVVPIERVAKSITPHDPVTQAIRISAGHAIRYSHRIPAPIGQYSKMQSSRILDDYEINQGSSVALHSIDDFLVNAQLKELPRDLTGLVRLHYRGFDYEMHLSSTIDFVPPQAKKISLDKHGALVLPPAREMAFATCDGRLLVSLAMERGRQDWIVELGGQTIAVDTRSKSREQLSPCPTAKLSATSPIEISVQRGQLIVTQLAVARDLWLGARHPRDDRWLAKEPIPSHHFWVLGDNLPISLDCRERWAGGIPFHQIHGRLLPPIR